MPANTYTEDRYTILYFLLTEPLWALIKSRYFSYFFKDVLEKTQSKPGMLRMNKLRLRKGHCPR